MEVAVVLWCLNAAIATHITRCLYNDVMLTVDVGKLTVSMDKDVVLAPTKEVLSLRAYTMMSQMNRLRRASCQLYQQMSMTQVIEKLECEIETGRLAVRADRMLHADLGTTRLHLPSPSILLPGNLFVSDCSLN